MTNTPVPAPESTPGETKPEKLYRTGEVAKLFGVRPSTVALWINQGKIVGIKPLGKTSHWRIPESEVTRLSQQKWGDD